MRDQAWHLAHHWIAAWNAHDLDAIMSHYDDTVELISPSGCAVAPVRRRQGVWQGELEIVLPAGAGRIPGTPLSARGRAVGVNSVVLYYKNHKGSRTAEFMQLSPSAKVVRVVAQYSD